jgi:hypothetical protein
MLRPRRRALVGLVLAALALPGLAACGGNGDDGASKPSKAAIACRQQWKKLGEDTSAQAQLTNPSALPQRWNTVAATIDLYSTSATGKSCGDRIDQQEKAITALKAWSAQLTGYDMQAQLALVRADATSYAGGPWPPAPKPSRGAKKNKKPPKPVRPPRPALVAAALKTLVSQAPVATQQQDPAWEQASVIDLADPAATTKAKKDLAFLSTESSGWRACQAALTTIKAALAARPAS